MELKINSVKHFKNAAELNNLQNEKIRKTAREFESIFTAMMIKTMMKKDEGLFEQQGFGGDIFSSVFENHLAMKMSGTKGIGIADFITRHIEKVKTAGENPVQINISPDKKVPGIKPSNDVLNKINRYDEIINDASTFFGVDKNLIKSVIIAESAGNEKALSSAKAKGLMQLMNGTAKDMGVVDIWDPRQNIFGGTKYLAQMLRQYNGDVKLALASYNAGPGNVEKHNGVPPFEETRNYIDKVIGLYKNLNS
jgi:Rod binding domain-containing protein